MLAVISGDIIKSSAHAAQNYQEPLKLEVAEGRVAYGDWAIFQGDGFQLRCPAQDALRQALLLKARLKQQDGPDIRLAIGLGPDAPSSVPINEDTGLAYQYSGRLLKELKKQSLAFRSDYQDLDTTLNLMAKLAMLVADHWTPPVAELIHLSLRNPQRNQKDLMRLSGKSQSTVSEALKRGGFDALSDFEAYFRAQIEAL